MSSHQPYISFIVTSRNDNHGGDLLHRMQIFTDALHVQCHRHQLPAELIIVEWNPPRHRPPLIEALTWTKPTPFLQVRILTVPDYLHRRYQHADQLPLFQMIAKNVGIRRANGEFLCITNIDVILNDELMKFLSQRQLQQQKMYRIDRTDIGADVPKDATIQEQLRYCEQNLLRINARDGVFPLRSDGLRQRMENDIAAEGIFLEEGWNTLEHVDEPFRWASPQVQLVVDSLVTDQVLAIELEPGPATGYQPFALHWVDDSGHRRDSVWVEARQKIQFRLPSAQQHRQRFWLQVEGPFFPVENESRQLVWRAFQIKWEKAEADFSPNRAMQIFDLPCRFQNRNNSIHFGNGWYPAEGPSDRCGKNGASLILEVPADTKRLKLDLEPGPNRYGARTTFRIEDWNGNFLTEGTLRRRGWLKLDLPWQAGTTHRIRIVAQGPFRQKPSTIYPIDFRLWSTQWTSTMDYAPTVEERNARNAICRLKDWLTDWLKNHSPKQEVTKPIRPLVGSTIPHLHLGAPGDFTLMHRDHWFDVGGHPEWELYSLHIDSVLCYQAHYAGATEEVLRSPMRIYHIEHGSGSGWTPEGHGLLLRRLEEQGIPVMRGEQVLALAQQMQDQGLLLINGPDWGLARMDLLEQVPGNVLADAA